MLSRRRRRARTAARIRARRSASRRSELWKCSDRPAHSWPTVGGGLPCAFACRGRIRRAVVLAGIFLSCFGSPGVLVMLRYLIVLRRESARDWVRSGREFLGLMVRAGAVVDKIGVVSAYFGEGLGQVMGLFGDVSGAVVPGRDPEAVR